MSRTEFDDRDAREFLDISRELLCVGTVDGVCLKMSDTWTQVLGYRPDELEGRNVLEFVHPDDAESLRSALTRLVAGEKKVVISCRFRHRDETWHFLDCRARLCDDGLVRTCARDITESARLERRLRDVREFTVGSEDVTDVGSFTFDLITNRFVAFDGLRAILRIESDYADDLEHFIALVHPDDRLAIRDFMQCSGVVGYTPRVGEFRLADENQPHRWVRCIGEVKSDSSGAATEIVGIMKDISAGKRAEQRFQADLKRANAEHDLLSHEFSNFKMLLDRALELAISLSGSTFGYIYYYDEDTRIFENHAWSADVMTACKIPSPLTLYELDNTGIWGEVVRQRRALYVNEYAALNPLKKGLPEGHAPLERWMSVPVFVEGRIVGVAGCANKPEPYTEDDVQQLSDFLQTVWTLAEHKRVAGELAETMEMLKGSQRLGQVGSFRRTIRTGASEMSEEALRIFGRSWVGPAHPTIDEVLESFHPEDRGLMTSTIKDAWDSSGVRERSARLIHPDGTVIHVQVRLETRSDASGAPTWILGNISDVTARREVEERVLEYQERLRSLASEIAQVEEHERRNLATELHDRVSQPLAAAKLRAQLARRHCKDATSGGELDEALSLIEQAIIESRHILLEMSPPHVYDIGLRAALEWLAEGHGAGGLSVRVDYDRDIPDLEEGIRLFLFHAAREFLANVLRHAEVEEAVIRVERLGSDIRLSVIDHGVGFNPDVLVDLPDERHGFGIFSIRERASLMGAVLDIVSRPGEGTEVGLRIESGIERCTG